ncbi:MAG: beta-galactosidase GalB [Mucilaginibacter sp.]
MLFKKYIALNTLIICFLSGLAQNSVRKTEVLHNGWLFANKEMPNAAGFVIDEREWTRVVVPHDWAIAGPFNKENDRQNVKVIEDGETKEQERSGRTGGLPYIGIGWYRKTLNIPQSDKGKNICIEFDGAMSNTKVYLNGKYVGEWPYGYASFSFDITKYVNWGSTNIFAVRLQNYKESARWYPGAGIYRNVRLITQNPIHVAHWGTYITTPEVSVEKATVNVRTRVDNTLDAKGSIEVRTTLYDANNINVAATSSVKSLTDTSFIYQKLTINNPKLWSAEVPNMYYAITKIIKKGKVLDTYKTSFGVRNIAFNAAKGMLVNGIKTKLKGVCLHDDLGALGTAFNKSALKHHLTLLKAMGCNAIRGTHNPHAPEMLDLCDEMGFYYIDETFDEWKLGKVENGYHKLFDQWAQKDLQAMIHRDCNHPALIMYSIGNEIREVNTVEGKDVARFLTGICHATDPTRPVTAGLNILDASIANGLAAELDIPGWNYKPGFYANIHQRFPNWVIYGSETASTVSSRGDYHFPATMASMKVWPDNQSSAYDLEYCSWSQLPDVEWQSHDKNSFVAGEFVWTGVDYLGEPTPYNDKWPSRSSYFGIIDLAGIPKDRYFLYQSRWSDQKVLHVLPHWNWEGKEGQFVPVFVYTNYPEAELFINGKSFGRRKFNKESLLDTYRLRWNNAIYQPGELKVIAYNTDGSIATSTSIKTAGKPFRIVLKPDISSVKADGQDLTYVTVSVVDQDGNLCPLADNAINFTVNGGGFLRAVDNGNPASEEPFQASTRKAFFGKCMAIVQSNGRAGEIKIKANSPGLLGVSVSILAK